MTLIRQTSLPEEFSSDLVLSNAPCDSSVSIGNWVRWDGPTLIKAFADNLNNANVFGLVESKSSPTNATVRTLGISGPIFSGLDNSKEYLLSDIIPGNMTKQGIDVPTTAGHIVLSLGKPLDGNKFLVKPGLRLVRA